MDTKWITWLISQRRAWATLLSAVVAPVALSLGKSDIAALAGVVAGILAGSSLAKPKKKNIWD